MRPDSDDSNYTGFCLPLPFCANCKHGETSPLYIFCKHPARLSEFVYGYDHGLYPQGGIPQSTNHRCALWEGRP
jgi:hypothetical protein